MADTPEGKPPGRFQMTAYRCRCGHEWVPRAGTERPRVCPKCKSPNWDLPYKFRAKERKSRVRQV